MLAEASITLLTGGFGGARLAPALIEVVGVDNAAIITNPGDDLTWCGAEVWPDFDSVLYAVAGIFDEERGWGIRGDSTGFCDSLGPDGWFKIGDRDYALSRLRTEWLSDTGDRVRVAQRCCEYFGVPPVLIPPAADPHRTRVSTSSGWVPLQEYLVHRRAAEPPRAIDLCPASDAATASALAAMAADLVILGPSNPILSLMPILATPGVAATLMHTQRVIAVSPVVGSVEPLWASEQTRFRVREQVMAMVGLPHSASGCARFFAGVVDAFVVDSRDNTRAQIENEIGIPVLETNLLGRSDEDRKRLMSEVIAFGLGVPGRTNRSALSSPLRSFLGPSTRPGAVATSEHKPVAGNNSDIARSSDDGLPRTPTSMLQE